MANALHESDVSYMPIMNGLEMEKLLSVVESIRNNRQPGRTVWKTSARWLDGFNVEAISRDFRIRADEPEMLCGTNTASNPVELVLQAYGACLIIGYAMNATARGIRVLDITIDVEGEIDLPDFSDLFRPGS